MVYKGICLKCRDKRKTSVYIGEMSRSGNVRGRQHLETIGDHRRNGNIALERNMGKRRQNSKWTELPFVIEYKSPSHISRSRILSQFLNILIDSRIRRISVGFVTSENFAHSIDRDLDEGRLFSHI